MSCECVKECLKVIANRNLNHWEKCKRLKLMVSYGPFHIPQLDFTPADIMEVYEAFIGMVQKFHTERIEKQLPQSAVADRALWNKYFKGFTLEAAESAVVDKIEEHPACPPELAAMLALQRDVE